MTQTEDASTPIPTGDPRPGKPKGDKLEIVKVLVLALVSFLAGFALVLVFLRQPSDSAADEPQSPPPATPPAAAVNAPPVAPTPVAPPTQAGGYGPQDAGTAAPPTGGYEPVGGYGATPAAPAEGGEQVAAAGATGEGDALPEVPPGKTPDGMVLDGEAFYLKCWDDAGVERRGADCDRLDTFEKRFSTRLYVVDKCRVEGASASAEGKLSVASEVDFQAGKVSFWNAPSSDLPNAAKVGTCLRGALAGLPIQGIEHKYARYRVFFTVLFGKVAAKKAAEAAKEAASEKKPDEKADGKADAKAGAQAGDGPPPGKGKIVEVKKDKVRVRKTPVDGEVIGKISQGNQVRLLKQKDGWCQVVTPSGNEGWMICDALGL
jgi:hypothetical protein